METYFGHIRTPADAIKLFEACRLGLLQRVRRRLSEKERQTIKSGSVYVWDEREAGMRRWTDGKNWSPSRVSGSFLTYREMDGRRAGQTNFTLLSGQNTTASLDSCRLSDEDMDEEGQNEYRYKPDGLMKQTFSITTSAGQNLHLISYYSRSDPNIMELPQPTLDPQLRHIIPSKEIYPDSSLYEVQDPAVTCPAILPAPFSAPQTSKNPPTPTLGGPPLHQYPCSQSYLWPSSTTLTLSTQNCPSNIGGPQNISSLQTAALYKHSLTPLVSPLTMFYQIPDSRTCDRTSILNNSPPTILSTLASPSQTSRTAGLTLPSLDKSMHLPYLDPRSRRNTLYSTSTTPKSQSKPLREVPSRFSRHDKIGGALIPNSNHSILAQEAKNGILSSRIPSISSLVNADEPAYSGVEQQRPSIKLEDEDQRAIRVLDRKFYV